MGSAPASRYLTVLLMLLSAVWATGLLPGRWVGVAGFLALLVVHIVGGRVLQRRDYVTFQAAPGPSVAEVTFSPDESLPVYVTGRLSVEGAERRFTCLPGFYRTFATREHALMCQVRQRSLFRILHWPPEELGMWYTFFDADAIKHIEVGALSFAPHPMHTIAIEYEYVDDNPRRFRRNDSESRKSDKLYISSPDMSTVNRILEDLKADEPAVGTVQQANPAE